MSASCFAPAERAGKNDLRAVRKTFLENRLAVTLLEAIPTLAVVLNPERQIVAANRKFMTALQVNDIDAVMGFRPGEAVNCVYAADAPGGCGTGKHCAYCGAVGAILECQRTHEPVTQECRIRTQSDTDGGALDLEVQATSFSVDGQELLVLAMRDISAEKRRRLLERIFFHDVLNTAGGIRTVSQLITGKEVNPEIESECKNILARLSDQIIEEILSQQQLLAAEQGELQLDLSEVMVADLLRDVHTAYQHHDLTRHSTLELGAIPGGRLVTDAVIVRRILGNLVKNALEASKPGDTVALSADVRGGQVVFSVHNPGVMPEEVQRQIFHRSFSTKRGRSRGIGTYSVKLFTENYLHGAVDFTSRDPEGTTFTVTLPMQCELVG